MTQGTKRLTQELHRLEGLKLREILDEMAATGSPTVVLSFNGTQGKPVAAVALITGPDTADRVEALERPNQVAVPGGWRLSRIALDQVEIITPAGEKHWVESNSDDDLELALYALCDAMLAVTEWPEPTDEITRYLQEKARVAGMAPSVLNPAVALLASLIMDDMRLGEREIAERTREEVARALDEAADLLNAYGQSLAAGQVRSMAIERRVPLRAGKGATRNV